LGAFLVRIGTKPTFFGLIPMLLLSKKHPPDAFTIAPLHTPYFSFHRLFVRWPFYTGMQDGLLGKTNDPGYQLDSPK